MKTSASSSQSNPDANDGMPTDGNLITWIVAQAKKHDPVFRISAVRPTYVLSGRDALVVMDDPTLVERTLSVVSAELAMILSR